jgi:hypothetical protein
MTIGHGDLPNGSRDPCSIGSPTAAAVGDRRSAASDSDWMARRTRWLVFCGWFVGDWLSWQTPGALSPDLEDLL